MLLLTLRGIKWYAQLHRYIQIDIIIVFAHELIVQFSTMLHFTPLIKPSKGYIRHV